MQFIGGEPTLYPRLPDLIADAGRRSYEFIEVFTNGTLLSESLLETFLRWDVRLAFSIYASGPELHERITARPGSFERTVTGIRKAMKKGLAARVGIIATALNSGDIEATRDLLAALGVPSVGVDRVRGVGRGAALMPAPRPWHELCGACWRGRLCINPRGEVFPCVFSRFCKVGHVSQGLAAVLQSRELNAFRARMRREQSGIVPGPSAGCEPESTTPECSPSEYCSPDLGTDYCFPDYQKERCGPVVTRHCYPNTPCHP